MRTCDPIASILRRRRRLRERRLPPQVCADRLQVFVVEILEQVHDYTDTPPTTASRAMIREPQRNSPLLIFPPRFSLSNITPRLSLGDKPKSVFLGGGGGGVSTVDLSQKTTKEGGGGKVLTKQLRGEMAVGEFHGNLLLQGGDTTYKLYTGRWTI